MNKKLLLLATLLCFNFTSLLYASSTPTIARAYSDRFVTEVDPSQSFASIGALDTTFDNDGILSVNTQLAGGQGKVVQVLSDGKFLVGLSKSGNNSVIAKYTATGVVESTANFGASGIADLGTAAAIHAMIVDAQGRIVVGGGDDSAGTTGFLKRVSADGDTVTSFVSGSPCRFIGSVAHQTSGKIIVVGHDGTNAMIARYTAGTLNGAGVIDTTFGAAGYIIFNGTQISGLTSTNGLYNVVVGSDDKIYVAYLEGTTAKVVKFTAAGVLDTSFDFVVDGICPVSGLDSSTASTMRLAIASNNDLIIAAQVSSRIVVRSITSLAGAAGSYANFTSNSIGAAARVLRSLLTTSDGKIFLVGSNTADIKNSVLRLTSSGALDTGFNTTGYNEFQIDTPDTSALLYGAAIAPDGKLYVAGYEIDGGVTVPYVSRLNNEHYVAATRQFPSEVAQGDFDIAFGGSDTDSGDGIVRPFDGLYGASLQQTTNAIVELVDATILVGMSGKLDTSNNSNMMLVNLNADGSLNTSFSGNGKVELAKVLTNEYLTSILEDKDGNLLVSGHDGGTSAILRKYPTDGSTGTATWAKADVGGAVNKYHGVAIQASQRILAFGQLDNTHGIIVAYQPDGTLDTTGFNADGIVPGKITGADFVGTPLQYMGPIYGCVVDSADNIYIVYQNNLNQKVDVALIYYDGRGLIVEFNPSGTTPGIINDVFGLTIANPQDARIALDNENDLVVAAAIGGNYKLKRLFAVEAFVDSAYDTDFGTAGTLTVAAGTAAVINQLTVLNDNTIIITGADNATDDSMLIVRATQAGALDTTFNSQGTTAGILPLQIGDIVTNYDSRVATGLVVQAASGNMIVSGYEKQTSTLSVPMVMRIYGKSGTTQVKQSPIENPEVAGTLDTAFNIPDDGSVTDGSIDLSLIDASLTGSTKAVYAYRSGSTKQGYYLVGVDTGLHTRIARIRQNDNSLDDSFGDGGSGIVTLTGVTGINHISLDSLDRILVTGTQSGLGWARRLTTAGVGEVVFASLVSLVEINGLYQQKSGRYIVAGKDNSGNGVLVAFQDKLVSPATTLAVDTTFNPLGQVNGTAAVTSAGWFVVSATSSGLYNVTINSDDTILVAYSDTTVKLQKITANGSGRTASFNGGAVKDTTITPSSALGIRCAIDANGKIIVASSVGGNTISTVRYSSAGVIDADFNGGAIYTITANKLGTAGVMLQNVTITSEQSPALDDKIVLMGYNTAGGNGRLFAARLGNDITGTNGILDSTTWNISPSGTDVAGLITFNVNGADLGVAAAAMYDASIYINGTIYGAVAAEGTSNKALLVRIFGDNYIDQIEEQPFEVLPGVIDTTLDTATPGSGAYALTNDVAGLAGYTSKKMFIYASGSMVLGLSNGTDTKIVKYKSDRSLDTTFGASSSGVRTVTTIANLNDLFVVDGSNDDGSIYLTGDDGAGAMVTTKLNSVGTVQSFVAPNTTPAMTFGSAVRQTTNSRVLVSGFDGTNGVIVAYENDGSTIDLSFGDGTGKILVGTTGIYDMALDDNDRVYVAYKRGATIVVKRYQANGSELDTIFSTTAITQTTALSSSQIRLAIDDTNNHVVVAVQDGTAAGNIIKVRRFSMVDGSATGLINTITIAGKVLNLSDLLIDNAQNMYVVGYNSTDSKVIVAKVASTSSTTITLDTAYAAADTVAGVANLSAGANMTVVGAGALHPDRRVYVIGQKTGPVVPSMARVFGDVYVTQYDEALIKAVEGTIDTTLDPNDVTQNGGINLAAIDDWSPIASSVAYQVHANADGTMFIAFGDGVDLILGKVDADMNAITTFGNSGLSDGLTGGLTMPNINSIVVDSIGRILVAGMNGPSQKIIRYAADGASSSVFASTVTLTVANRLAEQKSGRLLLAGKKAYSSGFGGGTILAYKNTGAAIDTTYGPQGSDGFYAIDTDSEIDDMVVDEYDDTYIVYRDTTVKVQKITENGSGRDAVFSDGLIVDTGITATGPAHIAINNAGNILVAAPAGTSISTALYNGITGALIGSVQDLTASNSNSPVLTAITAADDKFVMCAYETTNGVAQKMLTIRILATGLLDTVANSGNGFGSIVATGIASYNPETAIAMYDITVQPDGKVVMVGKNATRPVLMRVYGKPYAQEFAQFPTTADAGTLDLTLFPSTGDLNIDSLVPAAGLDGYVAKRIYEDGTGKMLIAFDNGTHSILVRLYKDLTLDSTFSTDGFLTITGKATVRGLAVDSNGAIYVSGGATTSWMRAFNSDGSALTGFTTPTSTMSAGGHEIALQTLDRIILAGQDASGGVLYGYQSTTGELDPEFGNGTAGIYSLGGIHPIADIAIDTLDRIYIIYNHGAGGCTLRRINTNGSLVDTDFPALAFGGVTNDELRVIVDNDNDQVIIGAAMPDGFRLESYSTVNGATLNTRDITAGGSSTSHIANIYVTSDGKIVLVGYETTGNTIVVARLNSNLSYDTSFNPDGGTPGLLTTTVGSMTKAYDATIHTDDRIMIVGGNAGATDPYMCRVYGDDYVTINIQEPVLGTSGTLDPTFNLGASHINLNTLGAGALNTFNAKAVVPLLNGTQYIALDNEASASKLIRLTEGATSVPILDTAFQTDGIADSNAPQGVFAMFVDALDNLVLTGTDGSGNGWIKRYTSAGAVDTSFSGDGLVSGLSGAATAALEQTMARIVVAGKGTTNGVLRAFEPDGSVDLLFGPNLDGVYDTGVATGVYTMVSDEFDRLIIAYKNGTNVELVRLTSNGELDITFGAVSGSHNTGKIVAALANIASDETSIRVALDDSGRIIVAALNSGSTGIQVAAFDNGVADNNNGAAIGGYTAGTPVTGLTGAVLTSLVAIENENMLIGGYRSGSGAMWVARITSTGIIDPLFNPSLGMLPFSFDGGATVRRNNAMQIFEDGRISSVGYETVGGVKSPFVTRIYNDPYQEELVQYLEGQPIGTNDYTFGLTGNNIFTFFATPAGDSGNLQKARAIALQSDNRFIIALDGRDDSSSTSKLFLNKFNMDGILDTTFATEGQAALTANYDNEYVKDLLVFATPAGVNKAILAGYASSTSLSIDNSLLISYNLDTFALDSTFGGFDQDPVGQSFADIKSHQVVGMQSNSRIITGGVNYDNTGMILGYTQIGKLDKSFGADGHYFTASTDGIFTHAIDTKDRVVFAYIDETGVVKLARLLADGSGLDTTFSGDGLVTTGIVNIASSSDVRVAIDGSGNIVVAGMSTDDQLLMIERYTTLGVIDGAGINTDDDIVYGFTDGTITKLMIDEDNKIIVVGSDEITGVANIYIFRILADMSGFDTTFNTTGYNIYSDTFVQEPSDATLHQDGRVVVVGSEN